MAWDDTKTDAVDVLHAADYNEIVSQVKSKIAAAGVTYENLNTNGDVGTTSGTVCAGDDSRLSDSRTPTSHGNEAHSSTFLTEIAWGDITGTLSDQTDLDAALDGKATKTESDLTLYVYEDATGDGDGSSKANGFTTLQAAIDAIPDVAQNVTIIVSKGSTNYLGDTTTIQKASVKSLTIQGEFYAYEACDSNAVAGKVVDASADFSDFEVGDRVVCTKYSGTVGASSIEDYFYATITEVGEGYVQTSEETKVPTTGWRYLINQTVFDGNDGAGLDYQIICNGDAITVQGVSFINNGSYYAIYNAKCAVVSLAYCIFSNVIPVISVWGNNATLYGCAIHDGKSGNVHLLEANYSGHIQVWNTVISGNSGNSGTYGLYTSNNGTVAGVWIGLFNLSYGVYAYAGATPLILQLMYIDSTVTIGAYGYNITLVSCTNNATTPVYNLTSGGSIEEWDGQALPDVSVASAFDVLRLNSDKSALEFSTIPTVWSEVTSTSQAAAADNGYIANNASLVTITLPSTCAVGKIIEVAGSGAGGWKIAQNAGQKIVFGSVETTEGTTGYMESNSRYESVKLICITANTVFSVLRATGNPELV